MDVLLNMTKKHKKKSDICLIIEGSYPYVTGGVSSWTQQFLQSFDKEYTFSIVALTAGNKTEKDIKYKLPENVVEFKSFDLFDFSEIKNASVMTIENAKKRKIYKCLINTFLDSKKLFSDNDTLRLLLDTISEYGACFFADIFKTEEGYNFITEYYNKFNEKNGFLSFYYNFLNIFFITARTIILQKKLPDADLYHSFSTGFAGLLTCIHSAITDRPSLITEHGIYVHERMFEFENSFWLKKPYLKNMWIDYFKLMTSWQYDNVDQIVTLYSGNRNIQIDYGALEEKIKIIPNGVNNNKIDEKRKPESNEKSYSIGLVARIDPVKDIKTYIRVVDLVRNSFPDLKAFIIGPLEEEQKNYYQECQELVCSLNLEKNIIFTGESDVEKYYQMIDVLLLTSKREAMPLALLEGMALGIPIVATNVGACGEMLCEEPLKFSEKTDAGLIAESKDPVDIAEKCVTILQNPDLAREMSANGINRIENKYRLEQVNESYLKVYEKLLKKSHE